MIEQGRTKERLMYSSAASYGTCP